MPKRAIFVGIFLGLGAAGCAATDANAECDRGSDCASGACNDGQCVVATGGAAGSGGSAGSAAGSAGMAGSAGSAAGSGGSAGAAGSSGAGGGSGLCQPNHDGSIERAEAPLQAGLNAKFMVALSAPVDTMGTQNPDGSRSWNLAQSLAGDHLALVETQPLAGKWFAAKYPSATYASVLSDTEDLLGVFEVTSATLLLHGVVSPQDGLQKTELHYDPPISVLAFPLQEGKTWQTTSTVTGFAQGVIANYTEKYEYAVDAHGELQTPFGTFPVLRTRSTLTRTVGLITTTLRSFLFPSECFGVVAAITSKNNEPNTEFSQAGEVRRLAP